MINFIKNFICKSVANSTALQVSGAITGQKIGFPVSTLLSVYAQDLSKRHDRLYSMLCQAGQDPHEHIDLFTPPVHRFRG